ncbi:MAG: gamma-mobile-trio protein GmtX [Neptuniibacter sp.]
MTPQELLDKLKLGASAKQSKTLDAIYAVCQEQVDRGANDFSYATISRIGANDGVPKAQSIRNRSGEAYQALIKGFAELTKSKQPRKSKPSDAWIDEIADPKTRLLVSKQQAELIEAKRLVREIVPPGTAIVVDDRRGGLSQHRLSEVERRALEFLVSDEFLKEWDYMAGDRGEVIDNQGNRKFKPGTIGALRKALQHL